MNRSIGQMLLASFVAISVAIASSSAQAAGIWGYVARADVAAPGGKIQTWRLTGVIGVDDDAQATAVARANALERLRAKGNILVGPTILLVTPFVGATEKLEGER